jgi:ATP-dependent Clp protease ATP-binding subunit ClpA
MTSNLGSDSFKKYMKPLGFGTKTLADIKAIKREVLKAAEDRFTPEFRNRIDEIVVFSPLTEDEVKQIADLYLGKMQRQMEHHGKIVQISQDAIIKLVEKGFSPAYGARFLKRTIDEQVKLPLTVRWKEADRFVVDVEGSDVKIKAL